eukprot:TRINITY_DN9574_c0_g1_i4.p1 TRINITY_DN9574_c0_g1~~TRINITY_DN9574_c0_g1_i4.p1  ORF type:complete len:163 (-),score=15.07 TRINITY_DN9574_c0_g1_i4:9-497(-)
MIGLKAIFCWNWQESEPSLHIDTVIPIAKFNKIQKLFGPFWKKENYTVIYEMTKWIKFEWFHGDISRGLTTIRLEDRAKGSFLIRLSETTPNYPFTLAYMGANREKLNFRIRMDVKGSSDFVYTLSTVTKEIGSASSLEELVKQTKFLQHPCPKADNVESSY